MNTLLAFDNTAHALVAYMQVPILTQFFAWVTTLGDARTIAIVAICMTLVLWHRKLWQYKVGLFTAIFGSLTLSHMLKQLFMRERPDQTLSLIAEVGYSFPSMHAAVSSATFGYLAYMAYRLLRPRYLRLPWTIALIALPILIGASRVYLGVHYASDVIAGLILGGLVACAAIVVTEQYERSRRR